MKLILQDLLYRYSGKILTCAPTWAELNSTALVRVTRPATWNEQTVVISEGVWVAIQMNVAEPLDDQLEEETE